VHTHLAERLRPGEIAVDDPRWQLTVRIAESPGFRRAPKLRDLFLYVVQNGLAGREDLLTEHKVGQNVFGRDEHYNAAEDSIVRAQVRLLRKKLEGWFDSEGAAEALLITIPRGSYVPVFEQRQGATAAADDATVAPEPAAAPVARKAWRSPVALVLTAVLGVAAGWLARSNSREAPAVPAPNPLLAKLVGNDRPTLIVVQDASTTLLNNALRTEFLLEDFQSGAYKGLLQRADMSPDHARLLRIIDSRQYTSLGDLAVVRSLLQAVPSEWGQLQVIHPRHLHLRQLKASNAVLIGGSISNPWVQLYSDRLDFRLKRIPERSVSLCVENLRPGPGEPDAWCPDQDSYGFLALVPQTGGPGNALVMAGSSLEATEAAGEMVISRNSAQTLLKAIRRQIGSEEFSSFQAVIRSSKLGGTSGRTELVSLRAIPQPQPE
jgi:hypothetical protein